VAALAGGGGAGGRCRHNVEQQGVLPVLLEARGCGLEREVALAPEARGAGTNAR
jgi:hypothetical protein